MGNRNPWSTCANCKSQVRTNRPCTVCSGKKAVPAGVCQDKAVKHTGSQFARSKKRRHKTGKR